MKINSDEGSLNLHVFESYARGDGVLRRTKPKSHVIELYKNCVNTSVPREGPVTVVTPRRIGSREVVPACKRINKEDIDCSRMQ